MLASEQLLTIIIVSDCLFASACDGNRTIIVNTQLLSIIIVSNCLFASTYDNNRTIIVNTQLLSIKIDSNCLFAITYDYNRTIFVNTQLVSIIIDSNCFFAITYDYNRTIVNTQLFAMCFYLPLGLHSTCLMHCLTHTQTGCHISGRVPLPQACQCVAREEDLCGDP